MDNNCLTEAAYTHSPSILLLRRRNFTAYALRDHICFTMHVYVLIAVVVVSARYNKNTLPRTYIIRTTSLFQIINYLPGHGRNLAKTTKQLPWTSNFITLY